MLGFPGGTCGKEPTCQCRRHKRLRFYPRVRRIPWRRAWQPTPVFLPGESHEQRSLAVYSPCGCKESEATWSDWAHSHYFLILHFSLRIFWLWQRKPSLISWVQSLVIFWSELPITGNHLEVSEKGGSTLGSSTRVSHKRWADRGPLSSTTLFGGVHLRLPYMPKTTFPFNVHGDVTFQWKPETL